MIVLPAPNPNAPGLCCSQLGHAPAPSVHWAEEVHDRSDCGSHVPVPDPVQQENGLPALLHPELWGQAEFGSPSKQAVPAPSMSRQKPQNTLS